ncbi:DUF4238 domain-containing protein [Occultella kanbiaonis]|uniref:DUF4238 domain-containing protein n=1 Tax=Occultella kanbiaonis TaxID=2675754 RepID=UPI0012B7AF83|nr:DUF4238 domain-containing protein [Occultella kanbiaonis]
MDGGGRSETARQKTDTREHHVPRMYLKRFGRMTSHGAELVAATPDLSRQFRTGVNDIAVERGFYWGTDVAGVPHHDLEEFFTGIEANATSSFPRLLDAGRGPNDDALPGNGHPDARRNLCSRGGSPPSSYELSDHDDVCLKIKKITRASRKCQLDSTTRTFTFDTSPT